MLRPTCFTLLACCCLAGAASGEESLKIGVFDQRATGGQGASVDGLVRGLERLGYATERITDLDALTLVERDVVYLCDMHAPGNVHKDWRKNLAAFVRSGGSVLQTWHHHVLGEVGRGVKRVYGSRAMHVKTGHPAVEGVDDFEARFEDHIVERVGPAGTVLLANDDGEPVAVAGMLDKGKVISTGLALAIPNGRASAAPRGMEVALLQAFLAWLAPEVPREDRIAQVLRTPQLYVSPPRRLAAAGFDAVFQARVGYREAVDVEVECPDGSAMIEPQPATGGSEHPGVRSFVLTIATEPGKSVRRDVTVRARVGGRVLEQKVEVEALYGEPPEKEVRGVWLHVGADRQAKTVVSELERLGVNMAVLRIAGGTAAFYASRVQPDVQDPLAPDGDWLAEAVRHAHAHGIEIHPYLNNCVVEGRTSPESLARLRAAGRLQQGPDGRPIDWFCPSQDVNFEAMERPMLEIATRYEVDGVQYDFIRYPNSSGCFCPKCRERFERETGKPVARWPEDCIDGPRRDEWIEYRCGRISALVERISTQIRKRAPGVKISAAVFRDWPDCREAVGQDWVRWCEEGWLDFVCPMNYTLDPELFAERAKIHRDAVPAGIPVVEGIGIASGAGRMTGPDQLAVQIAIARRAGAAGFVGFCYTPKHTASLFGPLRGWIEGER